jgi:3',5'-cyclic AMP phosphodiesterase CpdA
MQAVEADSAAVDTSRGPLFCVISDSQAPIWVETIFLKENRNREATGLIFRQIQKVHPKALFMLGDVVNLGLSDSEWEKMDVNLSLMRDAHISVYPILGNHEVMFSASEGEVNFQDRFPHHVKTGYHRIFDGVAFVMLNSNFSTLTTEEDLREMVWYDSLMVALQNDAAVRTIVVACHHSPFSNSKIVGSSRRVQANFVPQFVRTPKARLFLSGHAHTFEHFRYEGKDFLVVGGGGGLQHPLYLGTNMKFFDLSPPPPKPMFFYVTLQTEGDTLRVVVQRLTEDFKDFVDYYAVEIPLVDRATGDQKVQH